ncbi:MAG: 50S ribosomal protein L5 [Candidatus Chisholmbacteria bacterium RIFCSPHIGHO2_12_FULL_49_9]|uniref:Large ribosomal subunit protein uL5 n=1 Tax=Candidatus Chisholmbacteria bacterium RIFCSPHIGHO2_01_FULL_52_32 TaxID=1797591 RepID=A0A1G1VTW7_9BACT|nr:MAG: 50S ribosomal protein L5 [Candidatus Chisholmbacteria bacterium RIFCSPHIGHO2_01_FULL_52_32]OGY19230.1 MAG: 50S ribosomal protein L5 [Candidatus Chisholmbacteria bacterium RIFCSPHIGHO2_12_FULL_49_9]OGY19790.1 MAG: 50S ribosomal protein L5 [Candidatus Chisholmbacteria bacterium RIFCSPLOWO2_01_FULL_50_28]
MNRLRQKYQKEIIPVLKKELGVKNELAAPRLKAIFLNTGINEPQGQKEALKEMSEQLAVITGQRPVITRAKQAIADFKIKEGDPIGLKVTLRGQRMYDFFEKLVTIVLPRVRDFQGTKKTAFDGHGNYSLGVTEQLIFPEVSYDKISKTRGLEITITTTAKEDKLAMRLLELLGMPFAKPELAKGKLSDERRIPRRKDNLS